MTKNFLSVLIVFFGIYLLLSARYISNAIQNIHFPVESGEVTVSHTEAYSYELIVANKETLILFNKENGEYWKRPIDSKGRQKIGVISLHSGGMNNSRTFCL